MRPLIAEEEILTGERELRRSLARASRRGLVLERRGPEGRAYFAVSSEGWELLRSRSGT